MKPTITIARRACEAAGARQAVLVVFDDAGRFGVVSYGETVAECKAVAPLCDEIAVALQEGLLPNPRRGTK